MYQVKLEEPGHTLAELVNAVQNGEEAIITRNNLAVAKVVATMAEVAQEPRKPGSAIGKGYTFYMTDDFDAPLDEFAEYV